MASRQREELASRIALLYYEYQKSQNDIASELGISRSYVSQLLTFAKESGMVKISIQIDKEIIREAEFSKRFPSLRHAYIMCSESMEYTTANIGRFAAPHVARLIQNAGNIGVNPSRSVQSVIEHLDETEFPAGGKQKKVSQIMGGFNQGQNEAMMPGELVTRLAKKIGADCLYLNLPAIMENPLCKQELMRESSILKVVDNWSNLDLVLMGIGAMDESSRIFQALNPTLRGIVTDHLAVCEITINFFDEKGQYLPILEDNRIGMSHDSLRKVATKAVIGHGKHRAGAILAGLRAGMIDVLITDTLTAMELERLMDME